MPRVTFVIEATYDEADRATLDQLYQQRDAQATTATDVADLVGMAAGDVTIRVAGLVPSHEPAPPAETEPAPAPPAETGPAAG